MKTKRDYKTAFTIVKEAIAKADPYSLLKTGSPDDEFDGEVRFIVSQLPRCKSPNDVARAIAKTFTSTFGEEFKPEQFEQQGEEVFRSLREQGLVE